MFAAPPPYRQTCVCIVFGGWRPYLSLFTVYYAYAYYALKIYSRSNGHNSLQFRPFSTKIWPNYTKFRDATREATPEAAAPQIRPVSVFSHETPSVSSFFDETWCGKKKLAETDLYAKPRLDPSKIVDFCPENTDFRPKKSDFSPDAALGRLMPLWGD